MVSDLLYLEKTDWVIGKVTIGDAEESLVWVQTAAQLLRFAGRAFALASLSAEDHRVLHRLYELDMMASTRQISERQYQAEVEQHLTPIVARLWSLTNN